jgi:hypothetical protein
MVDVQDGLPPVHPTGVRRLLALPPSMVDFERRGFRTAPPRTRAALEGVAGAFLAGFNLQLATPAGAPPDLHWLPEQRRGLAAEGAAMAAVLLDVLNPTGGRRFGTLVDAHQQRHAYLIYVGTGWAMAKLHRTRLRRLGREAPLLRWLAYDGMGFCQAFFASERGMRRWRRHPAQCPATCDIRYQGLGRSLWFRECGQPEALATRIAGLPARHHGDAWSGVGLAAAYAGGVEAGTYARLTQSSGGHATALAQGAAFGAEAWVRSGYTPAHAHVAVQTLAGVSVADAARWTWDTRDGLDVEGADATTYRRWRTRIAQEAARIRST